MGLTVVPQWMVDELGSALSSDDNTGRVIAEQVMRSEQGDHVMALILEDVGTPIGARVALLPAVRPGVQWSAVADKLRRRALELGGTPPAPEE